jgi:hypothetical protein
LLVSPLVRRGRRIDVLEPLRRELKALDVIERQLRGDGLDLVVHANDERGSDRDDQCGRK